ncbi:MAG: hypothetical protein V3U58_04465 [Thermodesulfobacteriota bacterium]
MILKAFFKGHGPTIEEIDYWVVDQIEPYVDEGEGSPCGLIEMEIDFEGCTITPSSLYRIFFHTIRNAIKIKCVNCTDTQKAMIEHVYNSMKNAFRRGYPHPPCAMKDEKVLNNN